MLARSARPLRRPIVVLLTLSALLVSALTAGNAHAATNTGTTTNRQHLAALLAQAAAPERESALVRVRGGYEGSSDDNRGHITFWHYTSASGWKRLGTSTFPARADAGSGLTYPKVAGALLPGATHAVYIVRKQFSNDATAFAMAFAHDPKGWGVLLTHGTRMASAGTKASYTHNYAAHDAERFTPSELVVSDCSPDYSFADCGGIRTVRRLYAWTAAGFTLQKRLPPGLESVPKCLSPSGFLNKLHQTKSVTISQPRLIVCRDGWAVLEYLVTGHNNSGPGYEYDSGQDFRFRDGAWRRADEARLCGAGNDAAPQWFLRYGCGS